MDVIDVTTWMWPLGLAGLIGAFVVFGSLRRQSPGNDTLRALSRQIESGAGAFLRRQGAVLGGVALVGMLLVWLVAGPWTALAFGAGAAAAATAGTAALLATARAPARVAEAARVTGAAGALRSAFTAGAVPGLAVAGLGALAVSGMFAVAYGYRRYFLPEEHLAFGEIVAGFAAGASAVALFARIGGGIFAGASQGGAELAGEGIAADDPRNPAVVSAHVGDAVGRSAGAGADALESFAAAAVAAIALGATTSAYSASRLETVALPVLAVVVGAAASLGGILLLRLLEKQGAVAALRWSAGASVLLFLVAMYPLVVALGFDAGEDGSARYRHDGPFWALLAGSLAGVALAASTRWLAGWPARRLARSAHSGAAPHLIAGLAWGMESAAVPVLILCVAVWCAYAAAGVYGLGLAAVGLLAPVGVLLAVESFGPVASGSRRLARRAHLGPEVGATVGALRAAGEEAASFGRAFAAAAAALTALALARAYAAQVGLDRLDLADPRAIVGLLVGAAVPFYVAARTTGAVGRAAEDVGAEARRQLTETAGVRDGSTEPDSVRCVDVSSRAALREMVIPAAVALLAPVVAGALLGPEALGGLLAGAVAAGTLLAFFLIGTADAWGAERQEGAAGAALVGPALAVPFDTAAGPAMNIVVKLLAAVSLVIAPWLSRLHGLANERAEVEAASEAAREWVRLLIG